jgi:hypothetical protein
MLTSRTFRSSEKLGRIRGCCTISRWLPLAAICLSAAVAQAAKNDWAEGTPGQANGASREFYNRAGLLKWNHYMGDWRDAKNVAQGDQPYATADVIDNDTARAVEWDVTGLVQQWLSGEHPSQGFFLRGVSGGGSCQFRSREFSEPSQHPQLIVATAGGSVTITPTADTYLEGSTYRSMGDSDTLKVSGKSNHALLRFDLSGVKQNSPITKATLRLHTYAQYGNVTVGVFRCSQGHDAEDSPLIAGLASKYKGDRGIAADPDVVFFADFETDRWAEAWSFAAGNLEIVAADGERRFEPFQGKSVRAKTAKGTTTAMNVGYKFKRPGAAEPEEIYFRYYVRLADDWNQTVQGGKMPGISGTYGIAGWGGRRSNGNNGWSARGSFYYTIPKDNPLGGTTPIGSYCYHADQETTYGDVWIWQNGYRGFLENNRWYSVEQYVKLNTPGQKDGVLRAWIDGRPAFEKTDIRYRNVDTLKIEQVWMNVYHGGTIPSPYDQHLYIDNVVIARKYIGPMMPPNDQ